MKPTYICDNCRLHRPLWVTAKGLLCWKCREIQDQIVAVMPETSEDEVEAGAD